MQETTKSVGNFHAAAEGLSLGPTGAPVLSAHELEVLRAHREYMVPNKLLGEIAPQVDQSAEFFRGVLDAILYVDSGYGLLKLGYGLGKGLAKYGIVPIVRRLAGASEEVLGSGAARTAEEDLVNLASKQRAEHILRGDATGGGHLWPGAPGKTPFPQSWSAERILHNVADIATDPNLGWVQQTGRTGSWFTKSGAPARFAVDGIRDGVRVRVILEPAGEGIITAFPY